jgi:uncharacterized protein YciI
MKRLFVVSRIRGNAWDPNRPMNQQDHWSEHATFMDELTTLRFIVLGGPLGDEGDNLLVVDATDETEIRSTLGRDPWTQMGLLEIESIRRWTVLLQAGPEREPVQLRLLPSPPEQRTRAVPKVGNSKRG